MTDAIDLRAWVRDVLRVDPDAPAVEFRGVWYSWRSLSAIAEGVSRSLAEHGFAEGAPVGVVLRNDPALIGALLGVLLARGCIVTLNAVQGDAGLCADLDALRLPVVVAAPADWTRDGIETAAAGALGLSVAIDPTSVTVVPALARPGDGPFRPAAPGVAVEMLTSGTTGPPKRVPLTVQAFERTLLAAGKHYGGGEGAAAPRLRGGVAIVSSPLVHMSGMFRTLLNIVEGRRIVLMERFRVDEFVDAVQRHRPRAVSLVPAALAMVLDAAVPRDVFASVAVVTSGTAHLPVELQEEFEARYDVAVLPSYGATEFAGGVAGWNLALHREWATRKRGSVGRPQPGREVRAISVEDGTPVPPGAVGQIEVRSAGGEWVRTTDVGRVDEDGFVFIDGRIDDVIIRGGFKVTPADIVRALCSHPAVRDAGAVGIPDPRLGAVPAAAVELHQGAVASEEELLDHVRSRMSRYQVPVRVAIVEALPRTPSMKVSQPALRELLDAVRTP